jgi:hypothetical protein
MCDGYKIITHELQIMCNNNSVIYYDAKYLYFFHFNQEYESVNDLSYKVKW